MRKVAVWGQLCEIATSQNIRSLDLSTTLVVSNYYYSRLPITRTFRGNRKRFELSGVRITGSWEQMTWERKNDDAVQFYSYNVHFNCYLIGSGSGRNQFSIRNHKKCFKFVWKPFKWPSLLRKQKSFGETSFFSLNYLCFHYYLLARNCSVCRESCHDCSPKMFGSFARLLLCCRKK